MVWFKVDDNLAFHRKTLKAGNAAMGLWVRAGAECAQQLLDGFVPDEMVNLMGTSTLAGRLVNAGFWLRVDGGYLFHEWADRQPTRAEVEADRKAARTRKERWKERQRSAVPDSVPNDDGTDTHARASTRPDPTRPEKTVVTPLRGARLPDDFTITDEMRAWCISRGITKQQAESATERFINHWRSKTGKDATKLDWFATWRNWLLRDYPDAKPPENLSREQALDREMGLT